MSEVFRRHRPDLAQKPHLVDLQPSLGKLKLRCACTDHWLTLNPPPDPSAWEAIADPRQRLQKALAAFYEYYTATERMWTVSHQHALTFLAWKDLHDRGLKNSQKVELVLAWLGGAMQGINELARYTPDHESLRG